MSLSIFTKGLIKELDTLPIRSTDDVPLSSFVDHTFLTKNPKTKTFIIQSRRYNLTVTPHPQERSAVCQFQVSLSKLLRLTQRSHKILSDKHLIFLTNLLICQTRSTNFKLNMTPCCAFAKTHLSCSVW